jgi:Fe-S oxidoreductase
MKKSTRKKSSGLHVENSERLFSKLDARLHTYLNACVHCGLCGESCHYYLRYGDFRYLPGYKVDLISRVYRKRYTLLGRLFPKWTGARALDEDTLKEWQDILYGACTMCGRCSLHCSIGLNIPLLIRTARSVMAEMNMVPAGLQSTVDAAVNTGNNMAIPREELVDTLQWLEEDLQMEVNDPNAAIPMDAPGKRILYTLNPREPKFFPMSISAMAKIYYAAGESWTLSSNVYDVTNYAYYSGDDSLAGLLIQRLFDETVRLKAETLVLAECGHGFRSIRWEGPGWIEKPYPFQVISVIELIADYIRTGRIRLNPALNTEPVTLHDPCNLVRAGGILEEQRFVLGKAVTNFVEMTPNRENNYCCGGGGGQLSMGEFRDRRVGSGREKADQIRKTGARIVATPCHNCIDQLMELNKEYQLGVTIKTIGEIVADALVLE